MIDSNIFHVINKRDIYIRGVNENVWRGRDIFNDRKIYDRIKFTYSLYRRYVWTGSPEYPATSW